jgi:hypothetical protein
MKHFKKNYPVLVVSTFARLLRAFPWVNYSFPLCEQPMQLLANSVFEVARLAMATMNGSAGLELLWRY